MGVHTRLTLEFQRMRRECRSVGNAALDSRDGGALGSHGAPSIDQAFLDSGDCGGNDVDVEGR